MGEGQFAFSNAAATSFRDPAGRLFILPGRIIRFIQRSAVPQVRAFLSSAIARELMAAGRLVCTRILDASEIERLRRDPEFQGAYDPLEVGMVVEHERVPFPSFPYEWPPEMLHAAGCLTLDLAAGLLAEGLGLKDATPYNVLFRGPEPIFVDLLSAERRDPTDPTWLPYAQFQRCFLLPLLVNKHFGVPLEQILATRRDGIEPEEVSRLCGPLQKLLPPMLTLVSIPTWLSARRNPEDTTIYQKKSAGSPEKAAFILRSLLAQLRRTLDKLAPTGQQGSAWSRYLIANHHYSPESFEAKRAFVEAAVTEFRPNKVLDIGCNTGYFSAVAAKAGASVVAIDSDPVVVGQVWRRARAENLDILPLALNITRPSPGIGWRNRECSAFLDRARGAFDSVFMLALVHHLLVSERIPLEEILALGAELTTDLLVIEFIPPEDPMFRRIARGREELFTGLTREVFHATYSRRFELLRCHGLDDANRFLYLLRRKK